MNEPSRPASLLPLVVAAVVVLAVAAYFGWRHLRPAEPTPPPVDLPVAATVPDEVPAPTPSASVEHPVEPAVEEGAAPTPLPALADSDALVAQSLSELLTRQDVLTFLQVDGFVRRVVATIDNLPRQQAPVMVWPVNPTPQRFLTQRADTGVETIHPDNSERYRPLVRIMESVDTTRAVALYRRLYPLFQQAYEELGFPGRYFNDRLVQVLDHLIATPVQTEPPAVTLVEVKGEVPSLRPWVRYEFADPALESLSAGQKILVRMGSENHRRVQARLADVRRQVARPR